MESRALRVLLASCVLSALALSWRHSGVARGAQGNSGQKPACIFDHMMLRSKAAVCRPRAKAYPAGVKGRVQRAIYDSALTFGMPYSVLLAIARCESDLNPTASNGDHFGLFQFIPSTFRWAASQLRATTGVQATNYWKPLDSAYVAGFMFVTGESRRWACEKLQPTQIVGG
ncbi:MAG TPA: transglycosylase SLT domain-containing protein [Chloroflexota bacterium]